MGGVFKEKEIFNNNKKRKKTFLRKVRSPPFPAGCFQRKRNIQQQQKKEKIHFEEKSGHLLFQLGVFKEKEIFNNNKKKKKYILKKSQVTSFSSWVFSKKKKYSTTTKKE